MTFEAIILAAGKGKRLRPLTETRPKSLLYLPGGTLLDHQLRLLMDLGARRVVVVTGHLGEIAEQHLARSPLAASLAIVTVRQTRPEGLLNALLDALPSVQPPFFVIHGDSFLGGSLGGFAASLERGETAIAVRDDDDTGREPTKDLVSIGSGERVLAFGRRVAGARTGNSFGCYALGPDAPGLMREIGERGIPDVDMIPVFHQILRQGGTIRAVPWTGLHFNLNTEREVLDASRQLLDAWRGLAYARPEDGTYFGAGESTEVPGASVIGPAWIGDEARFERAMVGPYSAIGSGARLERFETRDAIVFPSVTLRDGTLAGRIAG